MPTTAHKLHQWITFKPMLKETNSRVWISSVLGCEVAWLATVELIISYLYCAGKAGVIYAMGTNATWPLGLTHLNLLANREICIDLSLMWDHPNGWLRWGGGGIQLHPAGRYWGGGGGEAGYTIHRVTLRGPTNIAQIRCEGHLYVITPSYTIVLFMQAFIHKFSD